MRDSSTLLSRILLASVALLAVAVSPCAFAQGLPLSELRTLTPAGAHPSDAQYFQPVMYANALFPGHDDGSWIALVGPGEVSALQAVVRAVDDRYDVDVVGSARDWTAVLVEGEPVKEADEVAVTRFSTGSSFTFEPRRSLPITPV